MVTTGWTRHGRKVVHSLYELRDLWALKGLPPQTQAMSGILREADPTLPLRLTVRGLVIIGRPPREDAGTKDEASAPVEDVSRRACGRVASPRSAEPHSALFGLAR